MKKIRENNSKLYRQLCQKVDEKLQSKKRNNDYMNL